MGFMMIYTHNHSTTYVSCFWVGTTSVTFSKIIWLLQPCVIHSPVHGKCTIRELLNISYLVGFYCKLYVSDVLSLSYITCSVSFVPVTRQVCHSIFLSLRRKIFEVWPSVFSNIPSPHHKLQFFFLLCHINLLIWVSAADCH